MSIKKINKLWSPINRSKSTKDIVVHELVDAILDSRLPIGSLMPPEAEMCKRLGVSRVAFREAVKQLEVLGFLRIERGNGTFVTSPTFSCLESIIEFLGKSEKISFKDLHHIRSLIEVEVVKLVAATCSDEVVNQLQCLIDDVEKNIEKKSVHIKQDYEFHNIILEASPNKLLPLILSPFSNQLRKSRSLSFKNIKEAKKTVDAHKSILDAIKRRAADEAAQIMRRHLERTAEDLGF